MDKKENFKQFVQKNPGLVKHVKSNQMSWQKFFELYDLYGEEHEIWNDYLKQEQPKIAKKQESANLADLLTWFKGMDLNQVQEGINSMERVISVLQELGGTTKETIKPEYKPRPVYKHFED